MSKGIRNVLITALSALICGFSVILPQQLGFLAWVGMTGMLAVLFELTQDRRTPLRRFYLTGLLYFIVFYASAFHFFLYMHPLDFTGIYGFTSILVVAVAWLGLSLLQALISSVFIMLFGLIARLGVFEGRGFLLPPLAAVTYVLLEWFQIVGWWGVPFARLSLSQTIAEEFIGSASLFGSYFITLAVVLVNACIALAVLVWRNAIPSKSKRSSVRLFSLLALGVFTVNLTLGIITTAVTESAVRTEDKIKVAVVQGNFSSKTSYDANPYDIVDTYDDLTDEVCKQDVDLVVWPETALPCNVIAGGTLEHRVSTIAKRNNINILYGALRYDDDTYYNCTFFAHPDGKIDEVVYKKRHLVPFGEYMPMREVLTVLLPFMEGISMLSSDMTPGEGTELFEIDGIGTVGSLICFDSIYEGLSLDTVREGAELIALGTNDSWFSDSVAIYIHNNQARLRAVECGRYIARAAVTGVSTVISPSGEILAETDLLVEDYAIAKVSLRSTRTLYSYVGNTLVVCSAMFFLGALGYGIYLTIRDKRTRGESDRQSQGGDV